MRIGIALGSNLGDRAGNLARAVELLDGVARMSSIYETEPMLFADQPWFLNQVVEVKTSLFPRQLLHFIQGIERHCLLIDDNQLPLATSIPEISQRLAAVKAERLKSKKRRRWLKTSPKAAT